MLDTNKRTVVYSLKKQEREQHEIPFNLYMPELLYTRDAHFTREQQVCNPDN